MAVYKKIILAIIGLLWVFLWPQPIFALEQYQEGPILLDNDFSTPSLADWDIESGTWQVNSENKLLGALFGPRLPGRINTKISADNYRIETDIFDTNGFDAGIGFRRKDGNNTYEATLRFDDGKHSYNTPGIYLNKIENGISHTLFSTQTVPLQRNFTYHVKIEVVGNHIQMWIDSKLIFDLNDPSTKIKSGKTSLSYWSGDYGAAIFRFDNIKITSLGKQKLPVIFVPGIGGSELKANQDIFWSDKDNGHGGSYSQAYKGGEKIWVNESEAGKIGDDDYFDVLKLKPDGLSSEADIGLTGWLTAQGYGGVDSFFEHAGYLKNKDYFVFVYDWRKDIRTNLADLDKLIELIKSTSNQPQVNILTHSMGGLIARNYISDTNKAAKINKLIELGTPHLGSVDALKILMYGKPLGRPVLGDFYLGLSGSEIKDISQNSTAIFQLLPSQKYFDFYNNTHMGNLNLPYPFNDQRDIDQNSDTGPLNYNQTKSLLQNLSFNMSVFKLAEGFHNYLDPSYAQNNGVKLYQCIGTGQPTLGQIKESYLITWPFNLISKKDEIFINGDDTVPLYSASLRNGTIDLSAGAKIYYAEAKHSDLVNENGVCMQTAKTILTEGDTFPTEVKDQKIDLEGKQITISDGSLDLYDSNNNHTGVNDQGQIETNIPNTFFDVQDNTKHAFIKKKAPKVIAKISTTNQTNIDTKIRNYQQDQITQTTAFNNIPTPPATTIEIPLDPTKDNPQSISVNGSNILGTNLTSDDPSDQPPPSPTPSPTPTPTPTPSASPTPSPTPDFSPSPEPSPTENPSSSPSQSPETVESPSPTSTFEPVNTPASSPTPAPSQSPSPSPLPTASTTPIPQPTASANPTPTPTQTFDSTTNQFLNAYSPSPTPSPTSKPSSNSAVFFNSAILPIISPAPIATPTPSPSPIFSPAILGANIEKITSNNTLGRLITWLIFYPRTILVILLIVFFLTLVSKFKKF